MKLQPTEKVIVIGPHCWGAGPSVTAAKREAVKRRPRWLDQRKVRYAGYICDESTRINEMGNFVFAKGAPQPRSIGPV